MKIIFCEDPLDQKRVDSMYQNEAENIRKLDIDYHLIDFESLVAGSSNNAIRHIPKNDTLENAIYRGWMLKPFQYKQIYESLLGRNIRLINTPEMYRHCHYLPESYSIITDFTPKSIWLKQEDSFFMDDIYTALKVFGSKPVILKDYVKSQKHYWNEACYIASATDQNKIANTVARFLDLQGDDLNEGLVFREFIQFQPLTGHSQSGMPLTEEYRIFVMDGHPIFQTRYWSEGDYSDSLLEMADFMMVMQKVKSRFFTMDIARTVDGDWMIVELGDGQVAGLPDHVDVESFYLALLENWNP